MTAVRACLAFVTGFAAATAVALVLGAVPARAQDTFKTTINPAPTPKPVELRRTIAPPTAQPPAAPEPAGGGFTTTVTPLRSSVRDAVAEDGEEAEEADVRPVLRGPRRPRTDGDMASDEPDQVIDGPAGDPDADAPIDGLDPAQNDMRAPEDAAVFEVPGALSPLDLLQAEIDPILDRRPGRLFRFEPFEPIGIKVGSMILLPEAEIAGLWSSNVLKSSLRPRSDVALDIRPSARLVSNWRTHALEFYAKGGLSYFKELDSEDDRAYTLEARGRLDITRRTNVEALIGRDYAQESRSSIDAPRAGERSNITTDQAAMALNHRFNRLQVSLRGAVRDITYSGGEDDAALGTSTGARARDRSRDYKVTEEAVRASWAFKPTLVAFVEAGLNQRDYEAVALSDGIKRDSSGEKVKAGFSFGNTNRKLRGEVGVGWLTQRPEDARLGDIDGVVLDANVAYRLSGLTTIQLQARTDIAETTVAGSPGAITRQIGWETRHALTKRLIATSGTTFTVSDYAGVVLEEKEWATKLGLEYYLSREAIIFGRYQHTQLDSTDKSRNYEADEVRVGMRIRR